MDSNALVRPLSGAGLVARTGDLLLVCAEADEADQLLGVVAEVAASGGDGGMLVRRVAALIAADFDGRFPDCAVSGPVADGRLAVLVHGGATADVAGGDGDVTLSGADSITSVTRMVAGPVAAVRLRLPGAGAANPRARLDSGVVVAAGVAYSAAGDGGAGYDPVPVPQPRREGSYPAEAAAPEPAMAPGHGAFIDAGTPVPDQRLGDAPAPVERMGDAPAPAESRGVAAAAPVPPRGPTTPPPPPRPTANYTPYLPNRHRVAGGSPAPRSPPPSPPPSAPRACPPQPSR
jgi:hypothetical protein